MERVRHDHTLLVSKSKKRWMMTLAIFEIVLGVLAIGTCIPTLILSVSGVRDSYYYYGEDYYPYYFWNGLYMFSFTSQGIWNGSFVVIAASANIFMAKRPTQISKSYSIGFSALSTVMTLAMVGLEGVAISWSFQMNMPNTFVVWCLHAILLPISILLFILILSSLILSCTVASGQGCCTNPTYVNPFAVDDSSGVAAYQYPDQQLSARPLVWEYRPRVSLQGAPRPTIDHRQVMIPMVVQGQTRSVHLRSVDPDRLPVASQREIRQDRSLGIAPIDVYNKYGSEAAESGKSNIQPAPQSQPQAPENYIIRTG